MSWLPVYISKEDLKNVSSWLCDEPNIALIKSVEPGKWQAFNDFSIETSGRYCLYHTECGPLPLISDSMLEEDGTIEDPFSGWQELKSGAEKDIPWFGPGHTAIFWFNVRQVEGDMIGMSSFEWIGNHYSSIDGPAPDAAKKWWARLGRWIKKQSKRIQRRGEVFGDNNEIYAMESALQSINGGCKRAFNP